MAPLGRTTRTFPLWRYLFLAPVYLLATSLPLLFPVGANLEYEYALLASYFSLLLIPAVALALPAKYLPRDEDGYVVPVTFEVFWILFISPVIGLLSGAYLFATGACPCSVSGFGFWMVTLWYPAWVLAHAAYHGVLRLRVKGLPRWKISAAMLIAFAGIATLAFVELWIAPQKRISNLVLGFLHGPIYDDWIAFDGGLLLARSAHCALGLMLLSLAWYKKSKLNTISVAVLAGAWLVLASLAGQFPSTQNSKSDLDLLLNGTLEGEGFTVHYRPTPVAKLTAASPTTGLPKKSHVPLGIQRLHRDTQFHIAELNKIFGVTKGEKPPHVHVYVYPNDDKKKLWFGGGSTDVTDVRTPSVHVSLGSWPHPTLRHELVHALASGFGYHGFGFHPNMAFTEGLAVALAPSAQNLTLDEGAASLVDSGRLPPVEDLFSPAFWKVSGGRAYTVAGSLIRYLIDTHGIAGVKKMYAGGSWDDSFGKSKEEIIAAWKQKITTGYDKEKNAIYSEALFRYPGVLQDFCPHSKADLSRSRNEGAYTRMRQPIGWDPDADYLSWLLKLDPEDKETRLRVWRKDIRKVALDRFPPPGRLATWQEALRRARAVPPKSLEDVDLAITESDVTRMMGDVEGSVRILMDLQEQGKERYFGESNRREIETRLKLEKGAGGTQTLEWRRYLAGWRRTLPDSTIGPGPWLTTYLKVRNDRDVKVPTDQLVHLLNDMPPDDDLPGTFAFEWYRIIGTRLMRSGHYGFAANAFRKASTFATAGTVAVFEEHARRADAYVKAGPLKGADDESSDAH